MLYVSRVTLQNVRCFERLDVDLSVTPPGAGWTVLVGDNATGKSTFLRSIAMGLCDEASAAGLLKESDEGYIRRGASKARIAISLYNPRIPSRKYRIVTEVVREEKRRKIFADRVRQRTTPSGAAFPWDEVFVSGYGAGRGVSGASDISSYSAIDAVYNMFNYTEGLQNPELVIRRLAEKGARIPIDQRQVFKVLSRATGAEEVRLTTNGLRVDGRWGEGMPLRDLADGYKSSVLWITDLIGWALAFAPRRKSTAGIHGVVLVDELEQHLHARWQRKIVADLRQLFPHVQFITATHSPLIASSIGPRLDGRNTDRLYVLEATEAGGIKVSPHEFMRGWRMDQVLASRAFRYQIDTDPEMQAILEYGSKLAAKGQQKTAKENADYKRVKTTLQRSYFSSTSPIERDAEQEARHALLDEIEELEQSLFSDEKK